MGKRTNANDPITMETREKIKQLNRDLIQLRHDQVTDIEADFLTRLGRYVKIQLIKYTLNQFGK